MEQIIISENDFQKARNSIKKAKGQGEIVFSSFDDDLNRKVLEKEEIGVLLLSQKGREDFMKQRNSGFNQVMAKIAKKKGIRMGIDFDEIIEFGNNPKKKAGILARISQNIRLSNKNKLKMSFISQKDLKERDYDLKALGLVLGMPTGMLK